MRGFADQAGIPWSAVEAALLSAERVTVTCSTPQAIRIEATAMVARVEVERVVVRDGRCVSGRVERVSLARSGAEDVSRGLHAAACVLFGAGRVREGHEMATTAKLLDAAVRS